MAINRGISIDAQFVPNATGTLYTPPTGVTRAVVTSATMYANSTPSGVELFIVPSGGSASTTTQTTKKNFSLDETFTVPELIGQSIETGGTIRGNDGGGGGNNVNIILTVTEFTGDS